MSRRLEGVAGRAFRSVPKDTSSSMRFAHGARGLVTLSRSLVRRLMTLQVSRSSLNVRQRPSSSESFIFTAVLVAALAVRVNVISNLNVNWDEFFYLSHVHDYLRGDLDLKLQTFHVHFFGWLAGVSVNEVDQVIAARAVMLGFHLVTAGFLYRIARRLTSVPAALFAVAAYLSVSFVIRSGASFRSDPIAICLIMAAFDLLLTRRGSLVRPVLAGLLLALAALITIKTAMFLPSLAVMVGAPLLGRSTAGEASRRAAALAMTAAVAFALLYGLHAMTLDEASARSSVEVAASSLSKTITNAGLFPRLQDLIFTLKWDMVFWAFWVAGGGVLARRIWRTTGTERSRWIEAAALALPVASIAVYRNSYPYYYPLILAPASVLPALAWHGLTERAAPGAGRAPVVLKIMALTWCVASLILNGIYLPRVMPLEHQRTVVAVVHRIFPASTGYLDRSSMVASFPQVGFFMSTWGIEAYLQRGTPVLRKAIEEQQPPLLIANHPLLDLENAVYPASEQSHPRLLTADSEGLARSYIHHWGPIYVAGKHLEASENGGQTRFDLLIAGRYTLEANAPVAVDGQLIQPGQSVELAQGAHSVAGVRRPELATLRWGEALYRPEQPAPELPLFLGF